MRETLRTEAAARLVGVNPRSFRRWARLRGIDPVHIVRVGKSTVTAWSYARLLDEANTGVLKSP